MGRTLVTLAQADLAAGDGGAWVVQGLTDYDAKGAPRRAFRPWFWGDEGADPAHYPLSDAVQTSYGRQRYDAFGRAIQSFGLDGAVISRTAHRPLCTDVWDAADIGPGPHQGTFASACQDGLGRAIRATERIAVQGKLEERHTLSSFLPSGEVVAVTRRRGSDTASDVTRWMRYDSLGRMVLNVEPNTSTGFTATPVLDGPVPATLHAWRYAYDYAGELVGTSDARGCGSNYHYDQAGRLVAEDYSPCRSHHDPYSAPDLTTGEGTEVFTTYDAYSSDEQDALAAVGQGFTGSPGLLLGRVASVRDRGSFVMNQVDCRGRVTAVAKQVAKPTASVGASPVTALAARYAPRWYVQRAQFDGADRTVLATTGAAVPQLLGKPVAGESSAVTVSYSRRGLVTQVGGSYGTLVAAVVKDADGLTSSITLGDLAKTQTAFTYDTRRRLHTVQTLRGPPDCWTADPTNPPAHCQNYHPSSDYFSGKPSTFPLLLQDTEVSYDEVDNPVAIKDWRLPNEWPAGAKPVSRTMVYDDLYRLTKLDYAYEKGDDTWVSPFAAEEAAKLSGAATDPRQSQAPLGQQSFAHRPLQQTYAYDWLGNTTATDDDAHGFFDRSLGTISNGTAAAGPYQLKSASNLTTPAPVETKQGQLDTRYDEAGNLVALQLDRRGSCGGAACKHRFTYEWDEVGRLVHAHRDDVAGTLPPLSDPLTTGVFGADLRYLYDGSNQRQVKTALDIGGIHQHAVYVFSSLELRGAAWESSDGVEDYTDTATTEVPRLGAGGASLGRVHWATTDVPRLGSGGAMGSQHVFLTLADHLGSASVVLDRDTGELAEAVTYQVYGATESDYRPGKWGNFRENHRFTGKEDDVEVGLTYFGMRYLSTALGRWVSPDPLAVHGLGADLNLYAYVHGHVFQATDPVGLDEKTLTSNTNNANDQKAVEESLQKSSPPNRTSAPSAPTAPAADLPVINTNSPTIGQRYFKDDAKHIINQARSIHDEVPAITRGDPLVGLHVMASIRPVLAAGEAAEAELEKMENLESALRASVIPSAPLTGNPGSIKTNPYFQSYLTEAVWYSRLQLGETKYVENQDVPNYTAIQTSNRLIVLVSGTYNKRIFHAEEKGYDVMTEDGSINALVPVRGMMSEREKCMEKCGPLFEGLMEAGATDEYLVRWNSMDKATRDAYRAVASAQLGKLINQTREITPKGWQPTAVPDIIFSPRRSPIIK